MVAQAYSPNSMRPGTSPGRSYDHLRARSAGFIGSRRHAIATDIDARGLVGSVRLLLGRRDVDGRAGLDVRRADDFKAPDRNIRADDDFLLTVPVLHGDDGP